MRVRAYPDSEEAARLLYFNRWPEPDQLEFLARVLRPGDAGADVGANVGVFTLFMAKLVGPSGRVEAFEPAPIAFARLEENVRLNALSSVRTHPVAAGAIASTLEFLVGRDAGNRAAVREDRTSGEAVQVVPVRRLDAEADPCLVVKVDVEGYESAVIEGADGWLPVDLPAVWIIECVERFLRRFGSTPTELARMLTERGYDLGVYSSGDRLIRPIGGVEEVKGAPGLAPTIYAVHRSKRAFIETRLSQKRSTRDSRYPPFSTASPAGRRRR